MIVILNICNGIVILPGYLFHPFTDCADKRQRYRMKYKNERDLTKQEKRQRDGTDYEI
ncbi:hypothetical protein GWD52_12775 [Enterobacteriaceae bacterium 4M9]|nr:hypothetical protein [Enterobacteriaceae bacterium 4M9]